MKLRFVLLLSLFVSCLAHSDSIDQLVVETMREHKIPGLAFAVVHRGAVAEQRVYGVANVEFDVPLTTDTLFTIASMTKTFTSAAILSLVEDEKFALDDPITKLLPDLPESWKNVTVRHCLSHTSALPEAITTAWGINPIADTLDDVMTELGIGNLTPRSG